MLKKLLEWIAVARHRSHVAALRADRDYYRKVILDATQRRADVQRQLDEVAQ